ncbi:MAG: calcium/sodium antiporter, partial [Halobaculum sp.]
MLVGFVLLYVGAEALVRGASSFSTDVGMRAAIAGVTVIAFATTTPELAIAVLSGLDFGETLGYGTIVGSNVANIGLVLGVSALINPLEVSDETVRRHLPFMILAAVLFVGLGFDGSFTRLEGLVLAVTLAGFTYVLIRTTDPTESDIIEGMDEVVEAADEETTTADGVNETDETTIADGINETDETTAGGDDSVRTDGGVAPTVTERLPFRLRDVGFILLGLVFLVFGARQLIQGGRTTLYYLGAGDRFVGLTVLALGTSLPELAASVVSAIRGEDDFSVGNVVGSNIYNILAVIGVLALLSPSEIPSEMVTTDFPFLIGTTGLAAALFVARGRIGRPEGLALLATYGFY